MSITNIRPIGSTDFSAIRHVDELTQIQYLGDEQWAKLTSIEKELCLVSRQPNFDGYVNSGYSFLVEIDNNVVGFIFAYETVPVYHEVYIEYIAIDPTHQGSGVAQKLFDHLTSVAKKNGIKKIWSLINLENVKSLKAHSKAGFRHVDRKEAIFTL
ncbi:MAG: GNAT family N-acetyltransferase [Candidatus Shapirobacteria bacterium]|jgi:L-amino acid N-acyltransferase YncA